jgi:hypothetical protein
MKWLLLWQLTGGRPMRFIRDEFYDHIVGRDVNSYMDKFGRYWFAFSPWSWNRLRMRGEQILAALHKEDQDFETLDSPSTMRSKLFGKREIGRPTARQTKAMVLKAMAELDATVHPSVSSGDEH